MIHPAPARQQPRHPSTAPPLPPPRAPRRSPRAPCAAAAARSAPTGSSRRPRSSPAPSPPARPGLPPSSPAAPAAAPPPSPTPARPRTPPRDSSLRSPPRQTPPVPPARPRSPPAPPRCATTPPAADRAAAGACPTVSISIANPTSPRNAIVGSPGSTISRPVFPTSTPAAISPITTGTKRLSDSPSSGPPRPASAIASRMPKLTFDPMSLSPNAVDPRAWRALPSGALRAAASDPICLLGRI